MLRINYHPKMKAISDLDLEAETRNFASAVMLDIFSHSETGLNCHSVSLEARYQIHSGFD